MATPAAKITAVLVLAGLLGCVCLAVWLWSKSSFTSRTPDQQAIQRIIEKTRRESRTGVEPLLTEAAPRVPRPVSSNKQATTPQVVPRPPPGYELVTHQGAMRRTAYPRSAVPQSSPVPAWLRVSTGLDALHRQILASERDVIFAVARVKPDIETQAFANSLARFDARLEGISGDYLRIHAPAKLEQLQAIAGLPEVLGLGAMPAELKVARAFLEDTLAKPANELVPVLVTLMGGDESGAWRAALTDLGLEVGAYHAMLRTYNANMPAALVEAVVAADFVMGLLPVGEVRALHDTAVPFMGADAMRSYEYATGRFTGITGQGIPVAVLDTGLNTRHIDIAAGRNSICGSNFIDDEHYDLWADGNTHGTHVTGTMLGAGKDEPRFAGMAPNVSDIRFAKVLDRKGFGFDTEVVLGMDYVSRATGCIDQTGNSPAVKPLIVNASLAQVGVSFSGRGFMERKLDAVVFERSQLWVVAQANSGNFGFSNLGATKNALAVGAVDESGQIAKFSSRGPTADNRLAPNLVASGVYLTSAAGAGARTGYQTLSGTSMASPSTAGIAALLMQAEPAFQNQPALARARLMASAVRPNVYLAHPEVFPSHNTQGPGTLQHAYGLGLTSARASLLTQDTPQGWTTGSATSRPLAGSYEYRDIEVPVGTRRLDIVMTWDEPPADTLTRSVFNNLDLWVDQAGDCTEAACGEFSSLSKVDNVEWVFITDPKPGTYRVKVLPVRAYGDPVKAAIAWTIIQGEPEPLLNLDLEQDLVTLPAGRELVLEANLRTSHYLASGTTLHLSCRSETQDGCRHLEARFDVEASHLLRHDGIARPLLDGDGIGESIYFGELGAGDTRRLRLRFAPEQIPSRTRLYFTATAWNARPATAFVDVIPLADTSTAPAAMTFPVNDLYRNATPLDGAEGSSALDLLLASREPGEPNVRADSRSVWYTWRAPEQGIYRLRLSEQESGKAFDADINIYTGEKLLALDHYAGRRGSEISFTAEQGVNYLFQIDSARWDAAPLLLAWEPADVRPANDDFAFAEQVTAADSSITGNNAGATLERGEFWGGEAASVWYQWQATADGFWKFQLDEGRHNLAIFTGERLSNLRLVSYPDLGSSASIPVKANQVYAILIASAHADASGQAFTLSWQEVDEEEFHSRAENDQFARATLLEGSQGKVFPGTSSGFTLEPGEPHETGIATAWWQWSAPETARYTWRILGADFGRLSIFTGTELHQLSLLASAGEDAILVMEAAAGTSYRIALGRSQSTLNRGSITGTSLVWGPTPGNDDRARAVQLTGVSGSADLNLEYASIERNEPRDNPGYESVWWRWSAPKSGWYQFWIADHPAATTLAIYPGAPGTIEPIASSERMFWINGRVAAWVQARAGEQYALRVANRPATEPQPGATLRWQAGPAPALLSYKQVVTNESLMSSPTEGGLANPQNLTGNQEGNLIFATSNERLLGFKRDRANGDLSLAYRVDADSHPNADIDFTQFTYAQLRWDATRERLLAHADEKIYAFELSADDASLRPGATPNLEAVDRLPAPDKLVATSDAKLVFALSKDPDLLQVFRVDADSSNTLRLIQSLRPPDASTENASTENELLVKDMQDVMDLEIAADDSHLYLTAAKALLVFAIDATTGRVSQVQAISAEDPDLPGAFHNISQLRNSALDGSGKYLFVAGSEAPQIAVFEVSEKPAAPRFLDSVTALHVDTHRDLRDAARYADPGSIQWCNLAAGRTGQAAADVLCEAGFYTAYWDADESSLFISDYASTGSLDHAGNRVPELPKHRQLAQSSDAAHLYLGTGGGSDFPSKSNRILVFERASARHLDESGNHAPARNKPLADQIARVGVEFSYQFNADSFVDADQDPLTYRAAGTPSWLAFDAAQRRFTGTPKSEHLSFAPHIIRVTASDLSGAEVSARFALRVEPQVSEQNAAPLQNRIIPDQTAAAGTEFRLQFAADTFRDPDGDSLHYSASGLPDWLGFDAATRTFSGTPSGADTTTSPVLVGIVADDGRGGRTRATFNLFVVRAAGAEARISLSSSAPTLKEWGNDAPVTLTLALEAPVATDQVLTLTATGSAELGTDFELASSQVTIPAGSLSANTLLWPILDFENEGEEDITLTAEKISGGVSVGANASLSLTLQDMGALFANAKRRLYGELLLFFADRTITEDGLDYEVRIYNVGALSTSPTSLVSWTSADANLQNPIGARTRVTIPSIDPGRGIRASINLDLGDLTQAGSYYSVAGVETTAEELPGRAYTNEDYTGFTLNSDLEIVTRCSDPERNTSPGVRDPLADSQWNQVNRGQSAFASRGGVVGADLAMDRLLKENRLHGRGVKVAVVDTGLELCHPDLAANVESGASYNFNTRDWRGALATDPYFPSSLGDHGTSVAGIIASIANNGVGGRGVASQASVRGYNFLEANADVGPLFDSLGGSRATPNSSDVDVFNMSFGSLGGEWITPPDQVALYRQGVTNLRGGKGAVYLKAGGNGFRRCASMRRNDEAIGFDINAQIGCVASNADPSTNLPYLLPIAAFNADGKRASYSAAGSSLWVSAPGGEYGANMPATVTTDQMGAERGYDALIFDLVGRGEGGLRPGAPGNPQGDYVSTFNGTSAATPNASAVVALLLAKYPELTWRDIKYLLARSARKIDADIPEFKVAFGGKPAVLRHAWVTNAAGYSFHNWYGFGAISVDAAVQLAAGHEAGSLGTFIDSRSYTKNERLAIPDHDGAGVTQTLRVSGLADRDKVEAVRLGIRVTHPFTNDLGIYLISPSGTESILHPVFSETLVGNADLDWQLLSNAFYGESPQGDWKLKVIDAASGDLGSLDSWTLTLWLGDIPHKEDDY